VGREKIREYASSIGETAAICHDVEAARAAGYDDVVAPPMFAAVYSWRAMGPAVLDPEIDVQLALGQPARGTRLRGDMDELREVKVTPDRYVTYRYAGASGDFNPIHLDEEFARSVDLPGKILHGLWTMAQVARVHGELAGDPLALKSLSVQFRGLGVPEEEITITSKPRGDGQFDTEAVQNGNKLVRRGKAVLRI